MIIFGSRTMVKFLAALIFQCAYCHTAAAQRLTRSTTWFTLFFLPIFPFGHGRYTMSCAYCGASSTLTRENAERFIADARAQSASPAQVPQTQVPQTQVPQTSGPQPNPARQPHPYSDPQFSGH